MKKSTLNVILIIVLCGLFYVATNIVTIREDILPQELRMIHIYYETPGASWKTLSDVDVTDSMLIGEIIDELEGIYLRVPISKAFFRNEKYQHELCISWRVDEYRDVDIRSNGRVVINGQPYI